MICLIFVLYIRLLFFDIEQASVCELQSVVHEKMLVSEICIKIKWFLIQHGFISG